MVMSPWPRFFRPGPPCRLFTVVIWLARRGCRAHTWGNRGRLGTGGRQSGARWSTWGVETACSRSWSSSVHRRRRPWRSSPSPSRLVSYTSAACSIVVLKLRLTVPLQLSSKQIQNTCTRNIHKTATVSEAFVVRPLLADRWCITRQSSICTCIIVKKLNSLKHLVRTTVAESHN